MTHKNIIKGIVATLIISTSLVLTGCSVPMPSDMDQIQMGMTYAEVQEIIGNNGRTVKETNGGSKTVEWTGLFENYRVTFDDGRVSSKEVVSDNVVYIY